jgi:B12 binding domain
MGEERAGDHISAECQQFIADATTEIVVDLGKRLSRPRGAARVRVLGVTPPAEPHTMALLFLLETLRQDGAAAVFAGDPKAIENIRSMVRRFGPTAACISCTMADSMPAALELIQSIKQEAPQVRIYAGGKAAMENSIDFLAAGCVQVCANINEGRRAIRRSGAGRRMAPGSAVPNPSATEAPAVAMAATDDIQAAGESNVPW